MANADGENSYEAMRQANIARNKALLESLGLDEFRIPDATPKPSKSSKKKSKPPPSKKRKTESSTKTDGNGSGDETVVEGEDTRRSSTRRTINSDNSQGTLVEGVTRRSSRNIRRVSYANGGANIMAQRNGRPKSQEAGEEEYEMKSSDGSEDDFEDDEDEDEIGKASNKKRRRGSSTNNGKVALRNVAKMGNRKYDPRQYGAIPGVVVGTWYETRALCSQAAVHAPWVAGIHGDPELGAFSIALSGGYSDDVDLGEAFTYTGAGGRDLRGTKDNPKNLRTAPQSCNQSFDNTLNKTLKANVKTKNPVRVIRGFKLPSMYAPKKGYRYDGLYRVEKAWMDQGVEGFMVCKYALKRVGGQPPLPKTSKDRDNDEADEEDEVEDEAVSESGAKTET